MDYETILRRALQHVKGDRVAVAMPYDLPQRVCHDLVARDMINGLIADTVDSSQLDPSCAGWWVDREREQVHLRQGAGPTLLIAGVDRSRRVGARLLLEARLKGVRRIVTANQEGHVVEDLQVDAALVERIETSNTASRITGPTFEDAFDEMYRLVGDRLRLPLRRFASNRVGIYVGSLGPGGAERQCAYTAVGISKQGKWDPHIVCDHFAPPADFFRPYVESNGIQVVQVNDSPIELADPKIVQICAVLREKYSVLNFESIFVQIVRYASLLRSLRPTLIHCWMDYCNTLAGTAAVLVGTPAMVLSCRSLAPDHFRIFQPYMRTAYRALLKRRNAVILNNSHAGAKDYARWLNLPKESVHVIHNGFDFPERVPLASRHGVRAKFGIPETARVVGSILRFSEEKRPQVLIDMARELHADDPSLRFLFFGGGVMLDETREYVESAGLQHVIALPGVTDSPWMALAAMDVFVLASRMEGLPNVLIEAQASGLPIVCARVGGTVETFVENETGISVEEATSVALAAAVRRILNDDALYAHLSARAIEHARMTFGLEPMIEATGSAYARAAAPSEVPLSERAA